MNKKILAIIIVLIGALLAALFLLYNYKKNVKLPRDVGNTQVISFEIKKGESVKEIAADLEKRKLITGEDYFKFYLWEKKLGGKVQAGTYEISPSMSIVQMVDRFTHGEAGIKSNEIKVSIPEGSSNKQILEILKNSGAISGEKDFGDIKINLSKYDFLSDKESQAEELQGYLFPDTYNFFKSSSLEEVQAKMLDNFNQKLTPQMRKDIKKENKSINDIIILASIIEKESATREEMPTIAGVFCNRLDIDMPLQSDATVNYVTGGNRPMPTSEDIAVDSPFNTYMHKGLPPAPICNPGIEAIKAAIYPEKTNYFYFLTTQDEERKTYFSKTYDEHLQNKAKYLK